MDIMSIIRSARAAMMSGRRFSPKEISRYETAIRQSVTDNRVEAMMLYHAEALHVLHGFGQKRIGRIIRWEDEKMKEWLDPDFDMDALRRRVYGETGVMFACQPEEQEYIIQMLEAHGFKVYTEEDV